MKKFSERRKILNNIPSETFYCYKADIAKNAEAKKNSEYDFYYIKPCKYYKHKKGLIGKCKLYKCEVEDQVKSCGLRE